jgi:hypothetical protein
MMKFKFVSAGLIAAAMFAGPAAAREHHGASRHAAGDRYVTGGAFASTTRNAASCIPAPRIGAFATAPWTNEPPCEPYSGY